MNEFLYAVGRPLTQPKFPPFFCTHMLIISNYHRDAPFKVSKKNSLDVIESQLGSLKFLSVECNSPVQYFCVKSTGASALSRDSLVPAKFFIMETLFEKPSISKQDDTNSYANLINDFGDKHSKDRIRRRDIITYASKQSITFNIENQVLPPFDKDAEDPKEVYSLHLMFGESVLRSLEERSSVNVEKLCYFVRSIYDDAQRPLMMALDCIYKLLSDRNVSERTLGDLGFFFSEVKDELVRGRLPQLAKDRLLVKFYIILLMASGFEVHADQLPRFGETQNKVIALLKIIGCSVTKSGVVKLDTLPKDTFSTKRIKR